jgi:predicted enzyme related to lactoylglutathione lyase
MPQVTKHAPGAFSWIELGTTDQNAAKHFYTSLFGWTFRDSPMGPNEFYTMFEIDGKPVAGGYTLRADQLSHGVPPHWNLYMSVENADATSARATELGGRMLAGPFDVFTYGRMSVIADPTGAVFSVWEPKDHPGTEVAGEPGSLCWADLSTPDPEAAAKFYTALFGYTLTPGDSGYLHIQNGETMIGGIQPLAHRNPNAPPHWLSYIQVNDCAASTEKAKTLGASIYVGPMDVQNVGIMTVLADPQGAVLALFQPTATT